MDPQDLPNGTDVQPDVQRLDRLPDDDFTPHECPSAEAQPF
jgi:hypothetical protein